MSLTSSCSKFQPGRNVWRHGHEMPNSGRVSNWRQEDIFRYVGYHFDWNFPGPCWCFLGKIAAKALYNDRAELYVLNYVPVGRREFIAYTTSLWMAAVKARKAAGVTELPPLNVIEVNFKKPLPGQPLEMFWGPARGLIAAKIRQCELKYRMYFFNTTLTQRLGRECRRNGYLRGNGVKVSVQSANATCRPLQSLHATLLSL